MNTLFNIGAGSEAEGTFTYNVTINQDSHIFQGHFPGNPIVPGVTSIILIRNCAQKALGLAPTFFSAIKEVKYLKPITPAASPITVKLTPTADGKTIAAEILDQQGEQFVKLKGTLN